VGRELSRPYAPVSQNGDLAGIWQKSCHLLPLSRPIWQTNCQRFGSTSVDEIDDVESGGSGDPSRGRTTWQRWQRISRPQGRQAGTEKRELNPLPTIAHLCYDLGEPLAATCTDFPEESFEDCSLTRFRADGHDALPGGEPTLEVKLPREGMNGNDYRSRRDTSATGDPSCE
jgi:hypothetical protein